MILNKAHSEGLTSLVTVSGVIIVLWLCFKYLGRESTAFFFFFSLLYEIIPNGGKGNHKADLQFIRSFLTGLSLPSLLNYIDILAFPFSVYFSFYLQ